VFNFSNHFWRVLSCQVVSDSPRWYCCCPHHRRLLSGTSGSPETLHKQRTTTLALSRLGALQLRQSWDRQTRLPTKVPQSPFAINSYLSPHNERRQACRQRLPQSRCLSNCLLRHPSILSRHNAILGQHRSDELAANPASGRNQHQWNQLYRVRKLSDLVSIGERSRRWWTRPRNNGDASTRCWRDYRRPADSHGVGAGVNSVAGGADAQPRRAACNGAARRTDDDLHHLQSARLRESTTMVWRD